MDDDLRFAGVDDLRAAYVKGEVSPSELLRSTLDAIRVAEPRLHAFLTVSEDHALAAAADADRRIATLGDAAWDDAPLLGMPISVKDLTPTRGIRTTRGSLRLRDWVPDDDPPAVDRLRRAGAIVLGKTNTSEFGWCAATRNRLGPPTANPWDENRSAGGSSGGAAAAVAAGLGVAATGTDGAGSIRVPAAFCGVVGLKPTLGLVPYVPPSVDRLAHLGPITRTVADAALLLRVMAGADPRDPLSTDPAAGSPRATGRPLRIGWFVPPGRVTPSDGVTGAAREALSALTDAGHVVDEIDPPYADPYDALVTILAAADAADEPAQDDGLADPGRARIAEHGRTLRGVDVVRAEQERLALAVALGDAMRAYDVLATPAVVVEPFGVDEIAPPGFGVDDLSWLAWASASYPFNLTGQPAISVPAGHAPSGLPVGLQLVGRRYDDDLLLALASDIERARPWLGTYVRRDGW